MKTKIRIVTNLKILYINVFMTLSEHLNIPAPNCDRTIIMTVSPQWTLLYVGSVVILYV